MAPRMEAMKLLTSTFRLSRLAITQPEVPMYMWVSYRLTQPAPIEVRVVSPPPPNTGIPGTRPS